MLLVHGKCDSRYRTRLYDGRINQAGMVMEGLRVDWIIERERQVFVLALGIRQLYDCSA